jgi:drug/metabolite transporter (DMT)-like permease
VRKSHAAAAVAVIWGFNFVAVDIAFREFPPLLLVALRFALVAVPALTGYGVWLTLLRQYLGAKVAPFSLLTPLVGMLNAWAVFGE